MTTLSPQTKQAFRDLAKVSRQRKQIAEKLVPLVLAGKGSTDEAIALAKQFAAIRIDG